MKKFNPNIHHRRSIRLKGYDYSRSGMYFLTICIKNKVSLLGEILEGKMLLNDAGRMVEKWYFELENKYSHIKCGEMIVMPNHFHCIVGADLRVCPNPEYPIGNQFINPKVDQHINELGEHATNKLGEHESNKLGEHATNKLGEHESNKLGEHATNELGEHATNKLGVHIGSPLPQIVQWFKTMTTNEYIRGVKSKGWQPFDGKLWQRNYWEHIIRNERSYNNIVNYIRSNPMKWTTDKINTISD